MSAASGSAPQCARAGCRADAAWQVVWRNPRIHTAERRKIWLACDEHVVYLRDYLAARDFPVEVVSGLPDDPAADAAPSQTAGGTH